MDDPLKRTNFAPNDSTEWAAPGLKPQQEVGPAQPTRVAPRPAAGSGSAPVDGAAFRPGDVIGAKYEVVSILGAGGFGVVYKVYSREAKAAYALKTFREELLADSKAREAFRTEAQVWLDLGRHPYIVRANFFDELHGRFYLAVELVAGAKGEPNTLQGWSERGPLPVARLLKWSAQFCHGMEHAHVKGVRAHKDIKPANVLVDERDDLKISDFGLAGALGGSSAGSSADAGVFATGLALTRVGDGGIGTPPFMSPEQWRSAAACDARSDIYSFGVMLYQLATARLPFLPPLPLAGKPGDLHRFFGEMRELHETTPPPPLDGPLGPVVARCLEKDPRKRYQGFAELRAELEPLLARQGVATVAVPQQKETQAWEWNNRGISLNDLGRFAEALECFDKALTLDPTNAKTMSNRGLALNGMGRHLEALEWAEKALTADPDELTAWNNKGCALLDLGRWEEADKAFEQALARNPRHLDSLNNRGYSMLARGMASEALICFDAALAVEPKAPTAWNNKGAALDKMGDTAAAMTCYERSLELDPFQYMAWMNTGIILRRQKRYDESLVRYRKCRELKPDYVPLWFNEGVLLEEMGRATDASAAYQKFLQLGGGGPALAGQQTYARERLEALKSGAPARAPAAAPPAGAVDALAEQASEHMRYGRDAQALPLLQRAAELDPNRWTTWANLAGVLAGVGRLDEALQAVERALALAADRVGPWLFKADILSRLDRLDEALRCYDRALEIDPKASPVWNNKAALLNRLERPEEALQCMARAIEFHPENFVAWLNRAQTEKKLGRREDALRSYKEFLRHCPAQNASHIAEAREQIAALERGAAPATDAQIKEWLDGAQILLNQGQLERAHANADRACAARPGDGTAWALKAEILARVGRSEEALGAFSQAVKLFPKRADLRLKRAHLLSELKKRPEALAAFDEVLVLEPESPTALNGRGMTLFQMAYADQLIAGLMPDGKISLTFKDPAILSKVQDAIAHFDRALKSDPQNPLARYNRSTVLDMLGRRDEAVIGYRQFLAAAPLQYKALADKARERLKALGGLG